MIALKALYQEGLIILDNLGNAETAATPTLKWPKIILNLFLLVVTIELFRQCAIVEENMEMTIITPNEAIASVLILTKESGIFFMQEVCKNGSQPKSQEKGFSGREIKDKEGKRIMEGFKSAESRLVRLFQKGREQWRKRAAEKQKKMRGMEIKIRDLSKSRDLWKEKAVEAQRQKEQLQQELEDLKKN